MNNSDYYQADRLIYSDSQNAQYMDVEGLDQPITKPYSSSNVDQGISVMMCPNCKYTMPINIDTADTDSYMNSDYDSEAQEQSQIAGMLCVNSTSCAKCGTALKLLEQSPAVKVSRNTEMVERPMENVEVPTMNDMRMKEGENIEGFDQNQTDGGYALCHLIGVLIALVIFWMRRKNDGTFENLQNKSAQDVLNSSIKIEVVCTLLIILICPWFYIIYAAASYLFNMDVKLTPHQARQ